METPLTKMLTYSARKREHRLVQDLASSLTSKSLFTTNVWQEVVMAESCRDFGVSYQKSHSENAKTFWILTAHPINLNSALSIYFQNMKAGRPERVTDKELEVAKRNLFPSENKGLKIDDKSPKGNELKPTTPMKPSIDQKSIEKFKGEIDGEFISLWIASDKNNELYLTNNLQYRQEQDTFSIDINCTNWEKLSKEKYAQIQKHLHNVSSQSHPLLYMPEEIQRFERMHDYLDALDSNLVGPYDFPYTNEEMEGYKKFFSLKNNPPFKITYEDTMYVQLTSNQPRVNLGNFTHSMELKLNRDKGTGTVLWNSKNSKQEFNSTVNFWFDEKSLFQSKYKSSLPIRVNEENFKILPLQGRQLLTLHGFDLSGIPFIPHDSKVLEYKGSPLMEPVTFWITEDINGQHYLSKELKISNTKETFEIDHSLTEWIPISKKKIDFITSEMELNKTYTNSKQVKGTKGITKSKGISM